MRITFVILGLSCVMMSCGDDNANATVTETTESTAQDDRITASTIEAIAYEDYALSPESEQLVVTWEKYQELATQIGYLKKADFSFFNGDKELLKEFILAYHKQMPSELRTNPIVSRNAIVETALLNLNERLRLDNIERDDKISGIKALFEAFSNLNYLINKKLEGDFYNQIQPE
ncbi:hypothetical protein [Winogradskyella vidalii]|uniref:hypothetical protein n=1 Tax=Winogradskyella vidalii TaxID=2615024 RepID=UPI0015CA6448|nr:hypothetical protein [Winogradskyella vidalii]